MGEGNGTGLDGATKPTAAQSTAIHAIDATHKYTVIRGVVYDVTDFIHEHPGGAHLLSLAIGRDATILFESYHIRDDIAKARLKHVPKLEGVTAEQLAEHTLFDLVKLPSEPICPNKGGDAKDGLEAVSTFPLPGDSELYAAIKKRVREEVLTPSGRTYGRGKCVFNTTCCVTSFVLASCWFISAPSVLSAIVGGLCGAWIGLAVQHTANHGALTKSPRAGYVLGLMNDLIGGSSLVWRYHHQVTHHLYTNDLGLDMDAYTSFPFVRLDPRQERSWYHRFQFLYAWLLFPVLPWSIHMQDMQFVLNGPHGEMHGTRFLGIEKFEIPVFWLLKVAHFSMYLIIPVILHGAWAAMHYAIFVGMGGFTLAVLFLVSHNCEELKPGTPQGIRGGENDTAGVCDDWCKWQIATSSSWGGTIGAFFTGGLNMQIEHHLLPGLAHNLYPAVATIIKEECATRGVPALYFDTLPGMVWELARFLWLMGVPETDKFEMGANRPLLK